MSMPIDSIVQDVRYAVRGLKAKPGFAVAVVATLALGIGANATMFGIIDRLLFRPPPLLKDPAAVHRVYHAETSRGKESFYQVARYARFRYLTKHTTSFSSTAGVTTDKLAVGEGDAARELRVGAVSATFFGFFDAPPALGRYFVDAEDQPPRGAPVTVLSYAFWQTQYGGRKDVLGEKVRIASVIYTIIGVAPRGFVGLWADQPPAAYVPIASYGGMQSCAGRTTTWWETYGCGWASMIVRRKPAVSLERANADLARADAESYEQERIEQSRGTPTTLAKPRAIAASILPDRGPKPSLVSKVAKWTGGVSIIVLLIACANVANLLLARGMRRRREIAVRLALGVSRARLLSQLFTESVLLAALGGAAGLLVANFGGAAVNTGLLGQSEVPAGLGDSRTILFALAAAAIVALLTGLAPVLQARHADLTRDLKAGAREGTYGRSRTRSALLVFQGALSVVLLVGAGLFVRSLRNVQSLRLGYDVDPILLVSRNMRGVAMDSAQDAELSDRLLRTAQAIPGVASAAGQTTVPFLSHFSAPLYVEGIDTVSRLGQFYYNAVTPDYFKTMGTRIVRGRAIEATDVAGSPRVMVVSEAMARALWPGRDPVGQRVRVGGDTVPWTTVVGVAENMREERLRSDSMFSYYLPSVQFRQRSGGLFVRVSGRGTDYKEAIRKPLQHEMPGASYVTVTPLADIVAPEMRPWNLGATMFVALGGLALVLAGVGLYSVIAYDVAQRTHELGVRLALGAHAADVLRLVVRDGVRMAAIGVASGVAIATWASRFVEPLLFDTSPRDITIYAAVSGVLLAVAIVASWVPARRAAATDPNIALRVD